MRIIPALLHLRWLDGLLTMFTTLRLFITEDIFLAPPMQMSFKDDLATKFLMGTFLLPLLNWNINYQPPPLPHPLTPEDNDELMSVNQLLPVKRTHEDDDAGDKQPAKKPMAAKKPSDAIKPKKVIPRPLPKTVKKPKIVKDDGDGEAEDKHGSREKKKTGGRTVGSTEYSTTELSGMVRLVLKYLPMGKKGWERVVNEYNKWASTNGYPPMTV
ncbi:hypothetical protein EV359DRAFT_65822 [Lentinula novae-zelandiae]|nr:hypothetical protein EV359DRAFT_65822 [Lentinula novae-zelandiae]